MVSQLSFSEGDSWRAYVDVDQRSPECLLKTSLWIARAGGPFQLAYFIAPERPLSANGMQILGWMPGASILLAKVVQYQWGSDAEIVQRLLAIEAPTGRVYEPNLADILKAHPRRQCTFNLEGAGFANRTSFEVLVRVRLSTYYDADETLDDVPPQKRCEDVEETWNFDYSSAYEVKRASNQQPLLLFTGAH